VHSVLLHAKLEFRVAVHVLHRLNGRVGGLYFALYRRSNRTGKTQLSTVFTAKMRPPEPFLEKPSLQYLLLTNPLKFLLYHVHIWLLRLRRLPQPQREIPIRIVALSDTHTLIPSVVPHGDILIHAGDLTNNGTVEELQAHIDWLASLPHRYKVAIAGNHDTYLDPRTRTSLREHEKNPELDWKGISYLQHGSLSLTFPSPSSKDGGSDGTTATRTLKIHGCPQIPTCGPYETFAFQYARGSADGRRSWLGTIPTDTDILITHTPPKYHLDIPLSDGLGCEFLMEECRRVKPVLHVFGHVHWGAGVEIAYWDGQQAAFESAMRCEPQPAEAKFGVLGVLINWRVWFALVKVLMYGVVGLAADWSGNHDGKSTVMVNAALMKGHTGKLGNTIKVVDI
jgi:hypothetical protein